VRGTITLMIFAGTFILTPLPTLAEGAMRILECSIEKQCDSSVACTPDSGDQVFNMEPIMLDETGAGSYQISYANNSYEMKAMSYAGPFIWNTGGETHTLLANSETKFLWHRLSFSAKPEASIQFLNCAFTQ